MSKCRRASSALPTGAETQTSYILPSSSQQMSNVCRGPSALEKPFQVNSQSAADSPLCVVGVTLPSR